MPVTVVVGGQFGSEGKGKVACDLARSRAASAVVRVGGSNSGHTVVDAAGTTRIFRHLPTAAVLPGPVCVIGPGSYLDLDVLLREIAAVCLSPERLVIDPNAVLISEMHKERERQRELRRPISSTCSGTGAAVAGRVVHDRDLVFAAEEPRLRPYVRASRPFLRQILARGEGVIIEGTQGFGLSVLHSPHYPHVTSRDTTAAAFVSEAGLSPLDVDEVVLVIRTFPIRVAGTTAGPLPNEIDWETVTEESGSPVAIHEQTSVTRARRRVGRFDPSIVRAAIEANNPTMIVLNHLDYVDFHCQTTKNISPRAIEFTRRIEGQIGRPVNTLGFGPNLARPWDASRLTLSV